MTIDNSSSPTAHVLTELQLHGYRPFQDEPDPRPPPEARLIGDASERPAARDVRSVRGVSPGAAELVAEADDGVGVGGPEGEVVEPRAEVRAALVEWWRLRHAGPRGRGPIGAGSARIVEPLLQAVICRGLAPDWREAYRRVGWVLSRTVRASSVVECRNSVVRMHQARHRSLSQPLLDLKRL